MVGVKMVGHKGCRTKLAHIALVAVLAALVVSANYSAARAGDDDDNPSFTDKFMRTLGLKNPGTTEYEINYAERSPLVVPPTRNLPPPASISATPAPNWPKDPDITRRKQAKSDDKPTPRQYDSVMEDGRPLRPDELNVGRATPTVAPPGTPEQSTPAAPGANKSIFSLDWMKKEQYATFTGEPPRASLTDPPPGYLTPSPDQLYGIGPEHKVYKPPTLGERMEPAR
jgi:hypothetical protein